MLRQTVWGICRVPKLEFFIRSQFILPVYYIAIESTDFFVLFYFNRLKCHNNRSERWWPCIFIIVFMCHPSRCHIAVYSSDINMWETKKNTNYILVQKQYERHLINNEQTTKGMVENFHNYAYKFNIIKKQTKCGCSFIMGIITCPTFIRLGWPLILWVFGLIKNE